MKRTYEKFPVIWCVGVLLVLAIVFSTCAARADTLFGYALTADGNIENPQPLAGARVKTGTIYVRYDGTSPRVTYYCCKAFDEAGSVIREHAPSVATVASPHISTVAFSPAAGGYVYELYYDAAAPGGGFAAQESVLFEAESETSLPPVHDPAAPVSKRYVLTWTHDGKREDGTAYAAADRDGYRVYWSNGVPLVGSDDYPHAQKPTGVVTQDVSGTTYTVTFSLTPRDAPYALHFGVAALAKDGTVSKVATEIKQETIELPPLALPTAPAGLSVEIIED